VKALVLLSSVTAIYKLPVKLTRAFHRWRCSCIKVLRGLMLKLGKFGLLVGGDCASNVLVDQIAAPGIGLFGPIVAAAVCIVKQVANAVVISVRQQHERLAAIRVDDEDRLTVVLINGPALLWRYCWNHTCTIPQSTDETPAVSSIPRSQVKLSATSPRSQ